MIAISRVSHTPYWTVRHIRRAVQTSMAQMGVRPDVVDRVLNHNVAGVRRHYDQYNYYPETKKALVRWDQRLSEIVSGKERGKVVSIR